MTLRAIMLMLAGLTLSACAAQDTTTRNAPLTLEAPQVASQSFSVNRVYVDVPRQLEVSEANRYFPKGDIVWREDPRGDRHAQVQTIVQNALVQGVQGLSGLTTVDLHVEVTRFHALTEKARYSIGGVHDIEFNLTLLDPLTGRPLSNKRHVKASLKALGGDEAIAAEARGMTQKYRITQHLAKVIQTELTTAGGFKEENFGMLEVFN